MSKEVAVRSKIRTLVETDKQQYMEIAPNHINMDRFVTSAVIAIHENKKLQSCDAVSIKSSILCGAELGLDFTKVKGHAYLIPFKNKCTFIPGYRGLIDLIKRTGIVKDIQAHIVHSNDKFIINYGSSPKIEHVPALKNMGEVIGAYAIAFYNNSDDYHAEFMTIEELEKIKKIALSKAYDKNQSPWTLHETEMFRKTTVRRLFKYLPSSPDIDRAIELDNQDVHVEHIEAPKAIDPTVETEPLPAMPKKRNKKKAVAPEEVAETEVALEEIEATTPTEIVGDELW